MFFETFMHVIAFHLVYHVKKNCIEIFSRTDNRILDPDQVLCQASVYLVSLKHFLVGGWPISFLM